MDRVNTILRRARVVVVVCGTHGSFDVCEVAAAVAVWLHVMGLPALPWWFVSLVGMGSFVVYVGVSVLVRRQMRRHLRQVPCEECLVRAGSLCGCLGLWIGVGGVVVCQLECRCPASAHHDFPRHDRGGIPSGSGTSLGVAAGGRDGRPGQCDPAEYVPLQM